MECSPTDILIGNESTLRLTVPIPKGVQYFHFMQCYYSSCEYVLFDISVGSSD